MDKQGKCSICKEVKEVYNFLYYYFNGKPVYVARCGECEMQKWRSHPYAQQG